MLTSLGRVAAQRLAPRRIAVSSAGCIVRVGRLAAHQSNGSAALLGAAFTKRTYASAVGRTKKTAAGTSATATKAKAKSGKTTAAPTKKAAPKKKTTKAKTAVSKSKKKPAVRRPKKVLSEEQKAAREQRKAKEKLRDQKKLLKEKAMLDAEPKNLPSSVWMVYVKENLARPNPGERVVAQMTQLGAAFKSLPSAEMQVRNSLASTEIPCFANQIRATETGRHR